MLNLKMGDAVTFVDGNALADVRDTHKARIGRGFVNGEPIITEGPVYWPLWCEREGREATTVMVPETNIIQNTA
jgi:hypothetical protein